MSAIAFTRRASDAVNHAAILLCIACVLAMLSISFIGFIYMVVTGGALSWTYSLARLFLPWIGLISITIAFHSSEHVAMTIVVKRLPAAIVRVCAMLCLAVIAIFALLMVWYGWGYFMNATQIYMVSDTIQISARSTAAAVPLTGAIILLHLSRGFDLLAHYADEEEAIVEVINDVETVERP